MRIFSRELLFLTLPTATAVVAISRRKLSPLRAGAPIAKGFVPNAGCNNAKYNDVNNILF